MRTILVAIATVALIVCTSAAQDNGAPPARKLTVNAYGTMAAEVLDDVAAKLDARIHMGRELRSALEVKPVWLVGEDADATDTLELLGSQLQLEIYWDEESGLLLVSGKRAPGAKTKGYDVSVLTGRYVEYINAYGSSKVGAGKQQTPASYFADLVEDVLWIGESQGAKPSVVGDRILFTVPPRRHERLREFLKLMMAEGGGESGDLINERDVWRKLKDSEVSAEFQGRPLASAFGEICSQAGVSFFIESDALEHYADFHIDANFDGTSAERALKTLIAHHGQDEDMLGVRNGFVFATSDFGTRRNSYRVIDVSELLRKLEASYQRQRTAAGKRGGFNGSLREDGGVGVILDALEEQLEAGGLTQSCYAYGARIIVVGGHEVVDAALNILKEMGWEDPQDE